MIGIDMEKISRFEHWTDEGLKRIFSKDEIKYAKTFENYLEHLCGFYCVKEALVKALDDETITFSQIEVLHKESGKPFLNENKYLKALLKEHGVEKTEISISHCKEYAVAVVQLY